ncbi:ABC transporter permease [Erysipelothrix urinaevulpis]|uniref:ABC transporter permease n=1 Tax=Erysipelothrix urinaevulpis TaxID=2683717 RepID=UPI00135968A3|nr:ABC transporter permease [Erysipelothrix urinaevulpis]
MLKYLGKRIMSLIPVVIIISILLFSLVKMMPGDVVLGMINPNIKDPVAYKQEYARIEQQLGLDKSLPEQYVRWVKSTVSGDLGMSTSKNRPVKDVIGTPLKNTIFLNIIAMSLAFVISVIVGIKSAVNRGGKFDKFWQIFSLVGMSMPTLLISVLLIYVLSIKFKLFPTGGMPLPGTTGPAYLVEWFKFATLPILTLTIGSFATTIRYVRNAMIEVLNSDYIRTARAKGLSEKVVIYQHAFRNALIPVVTILAGMLAGLFGGAAITEQIFSWNGIGNVLIQAVTARDFMLILSLNMFYAVIALLSNVIMDIGYAAVDPRVKLD